MADSRWIAELDKAVTEGLISDDHAGKLLLEARRKGTSPLQLLFQEGVVSEESLEVLQQGVESLISETGLTASRTQAAPRKPVPEHTTWGRFKVVSFLGQGGMGHVYKAYDPKLKRHVALKVVSDEEPMITRRFVYEAMAQARVDHDRVCKVYEVGEQDGIPFIAMQLIDGRPFHKAAAEMSLEQKLIAMLQVARGVHEAHNAGLIHRDIKPGNIMVEKTAEGSFRPYILDFGLARPLSEVGLTMDGSILGTPQYMSPEQVRGVTLELDRRCDVYGLGATLYHILTGGPPFPNASPSEVYGYILEKDVTPIRQINPDLPEDVEAIVARCLEKDPDARYDSARDLAADLASFLDGKQVQASLVADSGQMPARRRPPTRILWTPTIAILLLTLLGAFWASRVIGGQKERLLDLEYARLGQEIRNTALLNRLRPEPDPQHDRAAIFALVDQVNQTPGRHASGARQAALGWGSLSLEALPEAQQHFENAIRQGDHSPETLFGLVHTYIICARARRQEGLISSAFPEKMGTAEDETDGQAIGELLKMVPPTEEATRRYLNAGIATADCRTATLTDLEHDGPWPWWFHDRYLMAGDLYQISPVQSVDHWATGLGFHLAMAQYDKAAKLAPGDPRVQRAMAMACFRHLIREKDTTGETMATQLFEEGLTYLDRAWAMEFEHSETLLIRAALFAVMSQYQTLWGKEDGSFQKEAALALAMRNTPSPKPQKPAKSSSS